MSRADEILANLARRLHDMEGALEREDLTSLEINVFLHDQERRRKLTGVPSIRRLTIVPRYEYDGLGPS